VRWYILKNRRFEGPFTREDLQAGLKKSLWTSQDFALEEDKLGEENLHYVTVGTLLGLAAAPVESAPTPASSEVDEEMGEWEKEEVTRLFEEALENEGLVPNKSAQPLADAAPKPSFSSMVEKASQGSSSKSDSFTRWFASKWPYGVALLALCLGAMMFLNAPESARMAVITPPTVQQRPGAEPPRALRRPASQDSRTNTLRAPSIRARPPAVDPAVPAEYLEGDAGDNEAVSSSPSTLKRKLRPQQRREETEESEEDLREPSSDDERLEAIDEEENVAGEEEDEVEENEDVVE
jgi:hypothetical protein